MAFSLELSDDVIQVRDWVHEFAADVVRPAAAEWDEREETPWPIIQEAAKVGLYSIDLFAAQAAEPTGLGMLTVFEEMFWGDAGIALSILGTGLAAASLAATGTREQLAEWLPQMFGTVDDPKLASFCSSEPDAGSDVGAIATRARYDEATDEWVLNGTKTWPPTAVSPTCTSWSPRSIPSWARAGRPRSSSRRTLRVFGRGRSSASTASAPHTPPK
ncbi:acyl-CoA dehydrogenase, N-terminal domain protein [Mycobacterium xenopi 3993]|nr:acyl-CoA dehydrogenase, N-terminal domain protein [Mycobacterium xenopi 3993]